MANFPGTNIPLSSFKGPDSKKDHIIKRLNADMAAGDIQGMNDAIFDIAYWSGKNANGEWGQGQGNPLVSKVHNGSWKVTADVGANTSWAEDHVNSSGDVYNQVDESTVSWDDELGVLVDKVSTGSWGGLDDTEFLPDGSKNPNFFDNPNKNPLPPKGKEGKPPTNPVISGPGGDTNLRKLWPDVDWDGGGANSGDMNQYDWWESQNLYQDGPTGLFDWPEVDPQILLPGDFGFSKDVPTAETMYPRYNYLNQAGIGHNLAYAPGTRSAWMQRETAADRSRILSEGGTPTYYAGMEGGGPREDAEGNVTYPIRDLMYYYGGETPMNVPGGWTPQIPPGRPASPVLDFPAGEARQPVYPIAQTPLYPSGLLSPAGALPEGPPDDPGDPDGPADPDDPTTPDTYGGLLSEYTHRMGVTPGTVGDYMYRVTGEPQKVEGKFGGTGPDRSYGSYRVPLTVYGAQGGPQETFATRYSSVEGWDPSMNIWRTRQVGDEGSGVIPGFNINFADWTGTPGAYVGTERESRHPVFGNLLASPQNVMTEGPGDVAPRQVTWQSGLLDDSLSPSWLSRRQPSVFGTDAYANWGFPEMRGISERGGGAGDVYGGGVIGYGIPEFRTDWQTVTDPTTGATIPVTDPLHPDFIGADS